MGYVSVCQLAAGLSFMLFLGCAGGAMADAQKIEFVRLPAGLDADTIRFAQGPVSAVLFASRTTETPPLGAVTRFASFELGREGSNWKSLFELSQLLPSQPAWDVFVDKGPLVVIEKAGGALTSLVLRDETGNLRVLTGSHPMESFSRPQFSRTSGTRPHWVTAVADEKRCVAFNLESVQPYRNLGECDDGILLELEGGAVLISKKNVAGESYGGRRPGRLSVTSVNQTLDSIGQQTPLAEDLVYAFDATIADKRLVVMAVTQNGLLAATSGLHSKVGFLPGRIPINLTLKSLSIASGSKGKLALAARDTNERWLTAEWPLP